MSILKKTLSKTAICALTAAIALGGYHAQAAETVNSSASATVQNTFTFTEVAPLSFGTITAVGDSAPNTAATYQVDSAGATTVTDGDNAARMIIVSAATVGSYTIAGAAPTANITLTLPASTTLTCVPCGGGNATFAVTNLDPSSTTTVTTDGAGAAAFTLGGTLETVLDPANTTYADGAYSGTAAIVANY